MCLREGSLTLLIRDVALNAASGARGYISLRGDGEERVCGSPRGMGPRRRPTRPLRLARDRRAGSRAQHSAVHTLPNRIAAHRTELSSASHRSPGPKLNSDADTPARLSVRNRVPVRRSPSLEKLDLVERSLPFSESRWIEAPGGGMDVSVARIRPRPRLRVPRPAAPTRQRPTRSKSGPAAPAASRAARSDGLPAVPPDGFAPPGRPPHPRRS